MPEFPPRRPRGLYAITDGPRPDLLDGVAAAIDGGAVVVQYRDKTPDAARRRAEATALVALCHARDVPLIVNDDVDLALASGAAGVHLGEDDADPVAARARLGANALIGVSCYDDFDRATRAAAAGADWLAFGAFFPSSSKATTRRATPALLEQARALGKPLVAIGGITPDNAPPLVAAGADLLAVISGVFGTADPRAAAARYASLFTSGQNQE